MAEQIIKIVVNFIVTGLLGYTVATIKSINKKKKEKDDKVLKEIETLKLQQKEIIREQLDEMKSDLSNKFYIYDAMNEVEDYLVMSFREKCERYFDKGGDTWIHPMYDKSFQWKIKPTGYLD